MKKVCTNTNYSKIVYLTNNKIDKQSKKEVKDALVCQYKFYHLYQLPC